MSKAATGDIRRRSTARDEWGREVWWLGEIILRAGLRAKTPLDTETLQTPIQWHSVASQ